MSKQITARQAYSAVVKNSESYKEEQKRFAAEKRQAQKEQDAAFLATLQAPTTVVEMNALVEMMPSASKKVQKAICQMFASLRNKEGFIVLESTQYFTTEDGYVMYSQPIPQQEELLLNGTPEEIALAKAEMAQEAAETMEEEVKVVEQEEKKAMAKTPTIETPATAVELYNLSNEFNNMRQSAKKRTIATMLENMACEHGYITIEGKMYHFNGDKLTRNYEESKCYWCNVVKPVLTDETITYTIVSRPTSNGIPFIARVLVPGQEVQEYDPQPSCWWMYTEGDLVMAVNKQFKGAWYLKPEVFDTRVAEQQKVEDVASEMDIPTSEVAAIATIAQQAKERKQADRETFEAESRLETVPSYGQAQERQVVRVEKKSDFSMCGTSWFYAHPECFSIKKILQRDNTDGHRYTMLSHREVGSRATCSECGVSVHDAPVQRQEEIQHMEKLGIPVINQVKQTVVASIEHGTIPDGVYVDQRYRDELQKATSLVICGHDISILYEDSDFMEGVPVMAYGIHNLVTQEVEKQETTLATTINDDLRREMLEAKRLFRCENDSTLHFMTETIIKDLRMLADKYEAMIQHQEEYNA